MHHRLAMSHRAFLPLALAWLAVLPAAAQAAEPPPAYRQPSAALVAIAAARAAAHALPSPDGSRVLLAQPEARPGIALLARPELRLAGYRLDPQRAAPSRARAYQSLSIQALKDDAGPAVAMAGLPAGARLFHPAWSPDGRQVAFAVAEPERWTLWSADAASGRARRLSPAALNASTGMPCRWLPDSRGLLCRLRIEDTAGDSAERPAAPAPAIAEAGTAARPMRVAADVLEGEQDVRRFERHLNSRLARVMLDGTVKRIGLPGLYLRSEPSPDGLWILAERFVPPFPYRTAAEFFPRRVELLDRHGRRVRVLGERPLATPPTGDEDAVIEGPREFEWRADAPATVVWVEARDGGNPRTEAAVRDELLALSAPFAGAAQTLLRLAWRFNQMAWGNGNLALVTESWWKTRAVRVWRIAPAQAASAPQRVLEYSGEDRYADPGEFVLRPGPDGRYLLQTDATGTQVFLAGDGASAEGERPFLDRFDPTSGAKQRLFRSAAPHFERPLVVLDHGTRLLTWRETADTPGNLVLHATNKAGKADKEAERQITRFANPYPALQGVSKELIRYRRADGIELSATLYLPPGARPGDPPRPTILWAYPEEYVSSEAASQVSGSPYRFRELSPTGPLPFLALGYAVLDRPAMPIVDQGTTPGNDSFVEQTKMNAQAAVDAVVARGIADPKRMFIGGHSYGALLAVTLLAHTDLFAACIAQSGGYNRTLTPFGFQTEERNLWEARKAYLAMSPLLDADRIKRPLLLIHGAADNNAGTAPMQSERLFQALQGLGRKARLVMLPHESHGYQARESVLHVQWEMERWLGEMGAAAGR